MDIAKKSRQLFQTINADAVLLRTSESLPDSSVSYFTGIGKPFLEGNLLLMKRDHAPLLIKSVLEPDFSAKGLRTKRINKKKQLKSLIKKEFKGVKALGINKPFYPSASLQNMRRMLGKKKIVDVSQKIASMRAIKSGEEINLLAKACRISENAVSQVPQLFKKGMTEKRLGLEIELLLREKGDNILPYPIVVASGSNAAFPHHVPLEKKIGKGLLLLDFGAYCKNYASDLTRMFCIGKPSLKQQQLYSAILEAKALGCSLSKEGASFGKVFDSVDDFLKKRTHQRLIHGLGHGLGIDAHDFPSGFLQGNKEKLQKNMVLTMEPGFYSKPASVRIEDDFVVTKKGFKLLSKAPEELPVL